MTEEAKEYYRVEEVAEKLGVHHSTVRKWIKAKKIHAVFIAHWRISTQEMDRIMREGVK